MDCLFELIEDTIAADLVKEADAFERHPRAMMQIGDGEVDIASFEISGNLGKGGYAGTINEIAGAGIEDEMPRS